MPQPRSISVIIRTRTNDTEVLEVLRRLADQTRVPLETILVDSGSEQQLLERFRERPATMLLQMPPETFSSAGALNRGCAAARGDLIAILSQDALPANADYLKNLTRAFDDERVAGAYGRQVARANDHPLNVKDLSSTYPPQSRIQTNECWFDNCCSTIRADLWRKHPFDEASVISEDHEWGKWAIENGFVLSYVAEAEVIHSHPRTAHWLWNRFYAEGMGLARIHGGEGRISLLAAIGLTIKSIIGDQVWLLRRGKLLQLLLPLLDRPIKYAALYAGSRRARH